MRSLRHSLVPVIGLAFICASPALTHAASNNYVLDNLVSDVPGAAAHQDPRLLNAWGIAFNPTGFVWVSDNHADVSTLYDGLGNPQSLVVATPPAPTGIVFNLFSAANDFPVSNGTLTRGAAFIFATENGVLAGWAPAVDGTHALQAAQNAGAVYKGLALAGNGVANFLYAADLAGGKIDVYDRAFKLVTLPAGAFVDRSLPPNFVPFNIQNIQGDLYVTYAFRKPGDTDETAGPGKGYVNVFDPSGNLIRRVASKGQLNAPWGIALAPASFGRFANNLLIGNFGDGTINAYDAHTGDFKGTLKGANGKALKIDGLWGLAFGNGVQNQPMSTLFVTAGPGDEAHGFYGAIRPAPGSNRGGDDEDD